MFRSDLVEITPTSQLTDMDEFQGHTCKGESFLFSVKDGNFSNRSSWTFQVFVPDDWPSEPYISVQPTKTPNRAIWAGLERRKLQFGMANRGGSLGKCYARLAVADASGEKTRILLKSGDPVPAWLTPFQPREKHKVARSQGNDGRALIAVIAKADMEEMIRLYLALKPWVLANGWSPDGAAA